MSFNEWKETELGEVIEFDPIESLKKGAIAKKVGMDKLNSFNREIQGFEITEFNGGTKFKNGDTLLARITPCLENGKTAQVRILDKNEIAFGSTEFIVMREKANKTINDFIYYLSISNGFRNTAIKSMTGTSGRQRAQKYVLKKTIIKLPPIKVQKNIAHILSTLDDKIELNNKINENLQSISQLLFKHWFIDFEFPNEEGLPYKSTGGEMVDSELGMIPKGWKIKKVEDVIEVTLGGTPSRNKIEYWENGNIPWINSGKINEFRIIEPSEHITENGLKKSVTKLLPKRTTVIAITGATLGQVSLLEIDSCTNQSVVGLKESNILKAEFIYPWMKYTISKLVNLQTGGAQQHINKDNVNKTSIIMPEEKILKSYYNAMHPIFNKISEAAFENLNLKNFRDTLLPKLMNGEIDVSNIEINQ